ncbi:MAG: SPFH domain-containing protein [Polyangiaceae bacterium]|nr:SPFH domain-containing protein [Polyangiaceae bacterium]
MPHDSAPDGTTLVVIAALVPFLLLLLPFLLYLLGGFFILQPRTQAVILRFGKVVETVTDPGIHFAFPLGRRIMRVTSSVVSIDLPKTTVLEAHGSPIEVSGICNYRVVEAQKALLDVHDVHTMVGLLAGAVLKNVCAEYPYEAPDAQTPCLRKENEAVTAHLVRDLQALVAPAGVQVLQFRINDLTYAPAIAHSMLLRQQAVAMVDSRRTIVTGAVQTACDAHARMRESGLPLDSTAAASFASSLMMVLCSGERVQTFMPVQVEVAKAGPHG